MNSIWERNYKNKRYNKYPFDSVVSFIFRNFNNKKKDKIKILDLGCGGGNNSYFIAKEGFDLYAVDGSDESINITRNKLSFYDKNKIIKSYFQKLPFKRNFFDCVIDRQSLSCNKIKDIEKIVNEIYRILKSDGKYLGLVYSLEHPQLKFGLKLKDNIYKGVVIGSDYNNFKKGTFNKSGQIHFFSEKEIFNLFSKFKKINITKQIIKKLSKNMKYNDEHICFELEITK